MAIVLEGNEYELNYLENKVRDCLVNNDYIGLNGLISNNNVDSNCVSKPFHFPDFSVENNHEQIKEVWLRFLTDNGSEWAREELYKFYKYEKKDLDMATFAYETYVDNKRKRGEVITSNDYYRIGKAAYDEIGTKELWKGLDIKKVKAGEWFNEAVRAGMDIGDIENGEACIREFNQFNKIINDKNGNTQTQTKKQGCYIATAIYGSYDCPEVWTLRRYRDERLMQTTFGRMFVIVYYAISPIVVRLFGDTKVFNIFWKGRLNKFVDKLQREGYDNTPYYDRYPYYNTKSKSKKYC